MKRTTTARVTWLWAMFVGATVWAAEEDWKPLFAPDLSNADAPAGVWTVRDGILTADRDECIWTRDEYENFVLDLEFRCGPAANSGVILYCSDTRNWIPNSIEVQILDDAAPKWANVPPTWKCGGIFGRLAPRPVRIHPAGEWNRMTIYARGPRIVVLLNGEVSADMDMRKWTSANRNLDGSEAPPWLSRAPAELPSKGRIGLQGKHGSATIEFRNIRWRPLRPDEPIPGAS